MVSLKQNMPKQTIKSTGCCEPFNPEPWQDKRIVWKDKIFVKDQVKSFFHIPLDMGKKIIKNMGLIEKASAKAYGKNYVVLFAQIN